MFGWLARRRIAPRPPLRGLEWDGWTLRLALEPGATGTLALDVDGSFFAELAADAAGQATLAFPFSPSGRSTLALMPRAARDGDALLAAPAQATLGRAGLRASRATPDALPSASCDEARTLPFGRDVGALEVAIVVPVFNAPAWVERCLAAVFAHTTGRARLIVIDDASTDPAIAPLLARLSGLERVCVLANDRNLGFTATANRGIREAGEADVVLLNADAEVGPNWLAGLRRAAHCADDIASATAVSDNAGAFSVPELERENSWPDGWTHADAARALWQHAGLAYPELPTGNGFCLYLRRDALARAGLFDEAAFPQGYGEENDWCRRVAAHGLRHVIAGNVHVAHARSASFGDERRSMLGERGMAVLRERWPDYEAEVGRTLFSFERRVLDWRIRRTFAAARMPMPRVLWVGAGAPDWPDAEVWTLRANGSENELVHDGRVIASNTWIAHDPEPSYRALWNWLQHYAIERLLVAERKESAAEILCRLLDIPIVQVEVPFAPTARAALAAAESAVRSFREFPA